MIIMLKTVGNSITPIAVGTNAISIRLLVGPASVMWYW